MRIMAIDYGDARTGIAISDATGLLAGHTAVIQSRRPEVVAEEIARLKGITPEEVIRITEENARKLFPKAAGVCGDKTV